MQRCRTPQAAHVGQDRSWNRLSFWKPVQKPLLVAAMRLTQRVRQKVRRTLRTVPQRRTVLAHRMVLTTVDHPQHRLREPAPRLAARPGPRHRVGAIVGFRVVPRRARAPQ